LSKHLIVDYKIAAKNKKIIFNEDFIWPISHEFYDKTFKIFFQWFYDFPNIIGNNEKLKLVFELIEVELIEKLANIFATLVDLDIGKKNNLNVVYDKKNFLYTMILTDNFNLTQEENYLDKFMNNFNINIKSNIKKFRKYLQKVQFNNHNKLFYIGKNQLMSEIVNNKAIQYRITNNDLKKYREHKSPNNDIVNLSYLISKKFLNICEENNIVTSRKFNSYILNQINEMLINAFKDFEFQKRFIPSNSILFTGSGGNYISRLLSLNFFTNGNKVIRTTHGGDSVFFNDLNWPIIELPFISEYISYGIESSKIVNKKIEIHSEKRNNQIKPKSFGGGSKFHEKILGEIEYKKNKDINNITIVSASFGDQNRAIPNVKIHDVIYYEWHRRLLKNITNLGYHTIAKRHPKAESTNVLLFDDVVDEEKLNQNMKNTEEYTDLYIIDIAGSAFIEAICTLKPIIFIEMPNRLLPNLTKKILSKSMRIISAKYNEKNLVDIDFEKLSYYINEPVNLNERLRFISDYITSKNYNIKF